MADFNRENFMQYIFRMLLLAVFIKIVTSEGVRLPDARLRPLPVPPLCRTVNHCKENENDRDHLIGICFNDYCTNDKETVHCMEVENGKTEVIYFCSVPRFCDIGLTDKAVYNAASDQVLLTNIECPEPYFQPHPDFCNKTCRYKHRPTPAHVIILIPGNSSQSAIGVCNSSEGYVFWSGPNAPSVFSIDEYRDPCICRWDLESIGCSKEEDVCPNGTCVARCPPHLARDLCDCACKLENETLACQHEIPGAWFNGEINISTTTNSVLNNTTTGSESVTTERSHTKNEGLDTAVTVIIVMIAVLLILVGILIVVLYKCKRGTWLISYIPALTYVNHAETVIQSPENPESDTETGETLLDDAFEDVEEGETSVQIGA